MSFSQTLCYLALLGFAVGATYECVEWWRAERRNWKWVLVLLIPTLVGLGVRMAAPWGPHIGSGRDLRYLDEVIFGPAQAHTRLLGSFYFWLKWLSDPLAGYRWSQLVLGAVGCGIIAALTYNLVKNELGALTAGLLAAVLVALARVDVSPDVMPLQRLTLLGTLLLAVHYAKNRRPRTLAAVVAGLLAFSYGRLENLLFALLVLVWMATEEAEDKLLAKNRSWSLSLVVHLVVLAALVNRLLLVAALILLFGILGYRYRMAIFSKPLLVSSGAFAVLAIPRALEVLSLERDTANRFPWAFLRIFGKHNILLFDPGLCSPLIVFLMIAGVSALSRERLLRGYLTGFGLPFYFFCLIFMGDASARLKFQGMGILFLLPLAGLGMVRVTSWLPTLQGVIGKVGLPIFIIAVSMLTGHTALRCRTTLQQEYDFLFSLNDVPARRVYTLAPNEKEGHLTVPLVLQRYTGIGFEPLRSASFVKPGDVVYLGGGCFRYKAVDRVDGKMLAEEALRKESRVWLRILWDMDELITAVTDRLEAGMKDYCRRLMQCAGMQPIKTTQLRRSRLESRFVPASFPVGLYRVQQECYFSADE